jgi:hypothetical protein
MRVPALNRAVRMAVVGPGRIGGNAAGLWSRWGHEVQIGFRRVVRVVSPQFRSNPRNYVVLSEGDA